MNILRKIFAPSPRGKLRWTMLGIAVLFAFTAFYSGTDALNHYREPINATLQSWGLPADVVPQISFTAIPDSFRLGLDLRGGTHLVYDTDLSKVAPSEQTAAVEGVRDVIERRVNAFGVAEPIVRTVKTGDSYRVAVELAGVQDTASAIRMIGETPLLEFKEEMPPEERITELTPEQKKELEKNNAAARAKAEAILKDARASGANFVDLAKNRSEDLATSQKGGELGWISSQTADVPLSELLESAKSLKKGEIAPSPVKNTEGYNVVKLLDTRTSGEELALSHILICYQGASRCESELSKEDARKKIEEVRQKATPQNFGELAKEYSTDSGSKGSGGSLGWISKGMLVPPFEEAAYALKNGDISAPVETEFGYHVIHRTDARPLNEYSIARILVRAQSESDYLPADGGMWKDTGLTGKQLKRAYVESNQLTRLPEVGLEFNDEGKKLFAEITKRNIEKPVAVLLDGQPISVPRVNQAITDGRAVIQGDFTLQEAKLLAQRLNTGALPVPITLVSQQTIGPTLGAESLEKSLYAGLFGFLLVVIFMIFFYRLPGLLAVCALLIYTAIVLSIFKIWPVTLTLAGIAGFILSIGMAVDANVLIFERMKEELRSGKGLDASLRDGFRRAWTSIRDSNVASLITCAILFWFSASLIKGFALTLAIGILVSMFSAISLTRIFLKFFAGWKKIPRALWMAPAKSAGENAEPAQPRAS